MILNLIRTSPEHLLIGTHTLRVHTQDRWGYAVLHVANAKGAHVVISTLFLLSRYELAEVSAMNNCCLTALVGIFH